jgi:hypothetical protein
MRYSSQAGNQWQEVMELLDQKNVSFEDGLSIRFQRGAA